MTKLKLGPIEDDKPVKGTVELPAMLRRDPVAYPAILSMTRRKSVCQDLPPLFPLRHQRRSQRPLRIAQIACILPFVPGILGAGDFSPSHPNLIRS